MTLNILNKINEPKDLKYLSREELNLLSSEIRDVLIKRVSTTGGHFGPNLGMVEATIALHYVFNSPVDKFVYDVSHQSYVHKMLTGRKEAYINPEKFKTVTGYTEPKERARTQQRKGESSSPRRGHSRTHAFPSPRARAYWGRRIRSRACRQSR